MKALDDVSPAVNSREDAIIENDVEKFTQHLGIGLSAEEYVQSLLTAMQHSANHILTYLSKYALPKSTSKTPRLSGQQGREALYYIGCLYAYYFYSSAELLAVRDRIIQSVILLKKQKRKDILDVIHGRAVPEEANLFDDYPSLTVFAAANNQVNIFKELLKTNPPDEHILYRSPVVMAVLNQADEVLEFLLPQVDLDLVYTVKNGDRDALSGIPAGCLLSICVDQGDLAKFKDCYLAGASITDDVLEAIIRSGQTDFLTFCLKERGMNFEKFMEFAIDQGRLTSFKKLCVARKRHDPNTVIPLSMMIIALSKGRLAIVKYLHEIHHLPLVNTEIQQQIPLLTLLKRKYIHVANYLISQGVDHRVHSVEEWVCVMREMVLHADCDEHIRRYIDILPVTEHPIFWQTVFGSAAWVADMALIDLLLERGCTLLFFDAEGMSPLYWAIHGNQLDLVKKFVALEPRILTDKNGFGETTVMAAASFRCREILIFLLEQLRVKLGSAEDVSNFVNEKTLDGTPILSRLDIMSRRSMQRKALEDDFDLTFDVVELLARHGVKFFEETQQERTVTVEATYHSEVKSTLECLEQCAATALISEPYLSSHYLQTLSALCTNEAADKMLSFRREHLVLLKRFLELVKNPISTDFTDVIDVLRNAFTISPQWTEASLSHFVDELYAHRESFELMIKAIFSLPDSEMTFAIRKSVAEKCYSLVCSLPSREDRKLSDEKRYFLMLIIILYGESHDSHFCYLLLLDRIENVEDNEDEQYNQLKRELHQLAQRITSFSAEEKNQHINRGFLLALQRDNSTLIEKYCSLDPELMVTPLNDQNQCAIELAKSRETRDSLQRKIIPILLQRQERIYSDIFCITALLQLNLQNEDRTALRERRKNLKVYENLDECSVTLPVQKLCGILSTAYSLNPEIIDTVIQDLLNTPKLSSSEFIKLQQLMLCLLIGPARQDLLEASLKYASLHLHAAMRTFLALRLMISRNETFSPRYLQEFTSLVSPLAKQILPTNFTVGSVCQTHPRETLVALLFVRLCLVNDPQQYDALLKRTQILLTIDPHSFGVEYQAIFHDLQHALTISGIDLISKELFYITELERNCGWTLYQQLTAPSDESVQKNQYGKRDSTWSASFFKEEEEETSKIRKLGDTEPMRRHDM